MQEVIKRSIYTVFINKQSDANLDSHDVSNSSAVTGAPPKTLLSPQKTTSKDDLPAQDLISEKPSKSLLSYKQPYFGW